MNPTAPTYEQEAARYRIRLKLRQTPAGTGYPNARETDNRLTYYLRRMDHDSPRTPLRQPPEHLNARLHARLSLAIQAAAIWGAVILAVWWLWQQWSL